MHRGVAAALGWTGGASAGPVGTPAPPKGGSRRPRGGGRSGRCPAQPLDCRVSCRALGGCPACASAGPEKRHPTGGWGNDAETAKRRPWREPRQTEPFQFQGPRKATETRSKANRVSCVPTYRQTLKVVGGQSCSQKLESEKIVLNLEVPGVKTHISLHKVEEHVRSRI